MTDGSAVWPPQSSSAFGRIARLPAYVFAQVNEEKRVQVEAGHDVIDLGMGNPDLATPHHIVQEMLAHAVDGQHHRYSASRGIVGLRQAIAENRPYESEYRIIDASGTQRWVQEVGQPQIGADGRPWVDGILSDISERKDNEVRIEALRVAVLPVAGLSGDLHQDLGRGAVAVNNFLYISHTGEVTISPFMPLTSGNVRYQPLSTVYRYGELFAAVRDEVNLKGKCGRCEFRTVCGGSRARTGTARRRRASSAPRSASA